MIPMTLTPPAARATGRWPRRSSTLLLRRARCHFIGKAPMPIWMIDAREA
jgi:hypothetical protein